MESVLHSVYLQVAGVVLVAVASIYWYFTSTFTYWKDRGVPFLKPEPFFGNFRNLILLRKSGSEEFARVYRELEGHDYGGAFQSRQPVLIVRSPELVKHVLVKDFAHFHDRGMPFNEKLDPLSGHLFNLEGTRWKNLRVKLTPTFTSGKMKMMFHVLNECGEDLKKFLEEPAQKGEAVEMKEILAKFTTDVIGTCAFGLQFNSMKDADSEFRNMGRRIFKPTLYGNVKRIFLLFLPVFAKLFKVTFLPADIRDFFLNAVKDTVKYREDNHVKRNDFMDLLIQLKHKGHVSDEQDPLGKQLTNESRPGPTEETPMEVTDEVIAAQAFVFFLAGFETSSTTMSFCLHELALNPDIQDKLRSEVKTVLEDNGGQLTYEAVQKMHYMDQVINETLRKYPAVPNLIRRCTKSYTIPGTSVVVEKGTRVFVPVYALHHDPKYYPDPDSFRPERFTPEAEKERPNYTYLPFGEGPRVCIGLRFGLLQTKVGLSVILANYLVSVCEKTAMPLKLDPKAFVTSGIGGMWFKLQLNDYRGGKGAGLGGAVCDPGQLLAERVREDCDAP